MNGGIGTKLKAVTEYKAPYADRHTARGGSGTPTGNYHAHNLQIHFLEIWSKQPFLAAEKVGKLMMKYSVPCIISILVGALYNIVEQISIQKIA